MKKILLVFFSLLFSLSVFASGKNLDILTLFNSKMSSNNALWVGTFQLAFNEIKENIVKNDIYFVRSKKTKELKDLNANLFNKDMLNEASYYTSVGETSPEAKVKIEQDIKTKFNETSDILDSLDWTRGIGKYYAYAMLKKDFEFLNEFDGLEKASFNGSKEKYNYFGIKDDSNPVLDNNLAVLFYENSNSYAVRLYTKENDTVYLYRVDDNKTFDKLYKEMKQKSVGYKGNRFFDEKDTLKVPNLKVNNQRNYQELCNKKIKGTDIEFDSAIETIKFNLDNKGGSIKSEAAIMTKLAMLHPNHHKPRHFNFDKTFVIFLIDEGKSDPYFAFKVKNLKGIN